MPQSKRLDDEHDHHGVVDRLYTELPFTTLGIGT